MEDFYIMKNRNKIVAFLLAGVLAAGHGSVVYADVSWDLCAVNEKRMRLEVPENEKKHTDSAENNGNADIEEHEMPQTTSEYADIGIASVLNYVNLRAEPSAESEALGKLYNNSAATVLETVTDEAGTPIGDPLTGQKITIVDAGKDRINLELKDFKFGTVPVGDLEIKNVAVNDKGEVNGSASQVPIMNGVLQADITVSGTVKDKKANLLIDVSAPLTPGTDPIKMKVTFIGAR